MNFACLPIMKERIVYLDIIRIVACLMVILMHSPVALKEGETSVLPGLISVLMLPCNGLFFMTSGALLFGSGMTWDKFMKKRLSRIVWPTVIWSVVYVLVDAYMLNYSSHDTIQQLCWIPFHYINANFALWFMYTLLGCYFIIPIVEPWLLKSSKKELEAVLIMWVISIGLPMVTYYLDMPKFDHQSAWYYFGGFFGYLLMGWYMNKYQSEISWKKIILSFVIAMFFYVIVKIQKPSDWNYFCYLHPSTVCYTFGLFGLLMKMTSRKYTDKTIRILSSLSACAFGVYLIHVLFLTKWLKTTDILDSFSVGGAIGVRWILTTVVCFSIIFILKKFPFSKYVIG